MNYKILIICCLTLLHSWPKVWADSQVGDVVGKLIVGYQGWFAAKGDNSPMNHWFHWGNDPGPSPGHVSVEIWPDVREYTHTYQTSLGPLGNGQPAKVFSSWDEQTVDTHFKWMQENNIDGAALQRFAGGVKTDTNYRNHLNGIAKNMMKAAENHNRKFYIMWDVTDWKDYFTTLPEDLDNNLKPLGLFNSRAYAHQNGKPVLCVWGLGFGDGSRPQDAQGMIKVIDTLKNQGFYVIGGVPRDWRNLNKYTEVFQHLNMLQPWTVGSMGNPNDVKNYQSVLKPDHDWLNQHNIDYQPVLYAGSAWSNSHPGAKRNDCPRLHGDFLWQGFVNLRELGIKSAYIAMFDEYDEGTAIAKAAETQKDIPNNQYFLTWDADGVHVSSDFYLRLAGDGNRMMKGETPLRQKHTTPFVK